MEGGVLPSRLRAVTFTRAATQEMKERLYSLDPSLQAIQISTIHRLCRDIIKDTPERWRLKKIEFLFPDDDLPDIPTAQKPPLSINMAGLSRRRGNSSQKPGNKNASLRAK